MCVRTWCGVLFCMHVCCVLCWRVPASPEQRPPLYPASAAGGNKRHVPVSISMMKQIAGRAGRRSSQWPNGLATCLNPADVPRLQEALAVGACGGAGQEVWGGQLVCVGRL